MMKIHGLLPQDRVLLEEDPEFEQEYLGDPPEFSHLDALVWDVYWSFRNGTPSDEAIDVMRALEWFERLYCQTDPEPFGRQVRAMDGEFLKSRSEEIQKKKHGGDKVK